MKMAEGSSAKLLTWLLFVP